MMTAKVTQIVLMAILCTALLTEASFDPSAIREMLKRRILGGWNKLNVNDPQVQAVAAEATAHRETVKNSGKVHLLREVISAKYQIVQGKNYDLKLRIEETDCVREPNVNVEDCNVVKIENCAVIVWVWQGTSEYRNFTCRAQTPPGGEARIDVDKQEVGEVAAFAAEELTSRSNGRYRVEHRCITKATSQVVAGLLYKLVMMVSVTSVDNGNSKTARCTVKVWDQAWRTPRYTLEEYRCSRLISPASQAAAPAELEVQHFD